MGIRHRLERTDIKRSLRTLGVYQGNRALGRKGLHSLRQCLFDAIEPPKRIKLRPGEVYVVSAPQVVLNIPTVPVARVGDMVSSVLQGIIQNGKTTVMV